MTQRTATPRRIGDKSTDVPYQILERLGWQRNGEDVRIHLEAYDGKGTPVYLLRLFMRDPQFVPKEQKRHLLPREIGVVSVVKFKIRIRIVGEVVVHVRKETRDALDVDPYP